MQFNTSFPNALAPQNNQIQINQPLVLLHYSNRVRPDIGKNEKFVDLVACTPPSTVQNPSAEIAEVVHGGIGVAVFSVSIQIGVMLLKRAAWDTVVCYGVSVVRGVLRTAQSGHHALVLIWIIVPFVRLTLFGPPTAALWAPRLFRCTQAWDLHRLLLTHQECFIALRGLLGPPLAATFGNLLSVLLCVLVPVL